VAEGEICFYGHGDDPFAGSRWQHLLKRVLVTGASGFVGRNCLAPLAATGFDVHVTGRTPFEADIDLTFHKADLLDPDSRVEVLRQVAPTHLLHGAWDLSGNDYMNSAENYRWVAASLDLTRNFAAVGGTRAMYVGTCYEYLWSNPVFSEKLTPLVPSTHYGKAKAGLFELTSGIGDALGISIAWSRLFFLYGPYESRRRLVPSVISSLLLEDEAPTTHGRQERDYMYSVDVGRALIALLDSEVTGPVNIGTGTAVSIAELVTVAAALSGHPELLRVGALEATRDEVALVVADIDRLQREVGWNDFTPMEQGLAETVDWWRKELGS